MTGGKFYGFVQGFCESRSMIAKDAELLNKSFSCKDVDDTIYSYKLTTNILPWY